MKKLLIIGVVLVGAAVLAFGQVSPTDRFTSTYPPSGATKAHRGGGGPKPDEYIPFNDASIPTLKAYWSFDGSSSQSSAGKNYYGYDETYRLQPLLATPLTRGQSGPGGVAGGKNGRYIRFTEPGSDHFFLSTTGFRMSGSFSVSFWAQSNGGTCGADNDGLQIILGAGTAPTTPTDYSIEIAAFGTSPRFVYYDSVSGSQVVTASSGLSGSFQHYAFVYDSATKKGTPYTNGTGGAAGTALTNGLKQASTDIRVGTHTSVFSGCIVWLDELAFWNVALSAGNVTSLYNAGTGKFY